MAKKKVPRAPVVPVKPHLARREEALPELTVERARALLAQCKRVDEAKGIADRAAALRVYLRKQKASQEAVLDCGEIELEAARRIGELTRDMERTGPKGGRPEKQPHSGGVSKRAQLAAAGVTSQTASRAETIAAVPAADLARRVAKLRDAGKAPTPRAVLGDLVKSRAVEDKRKTNAAEELQGRYSVILADPPWQYGNTGLAGAAADHYPTMDTDAICKLPIGDHTTTNAVLFLWVTNPLLPDGLRVAEAWGFTYRTKFVWVKNRGTPAGFYCRSRTEDLWVCVRGKGMTIAPDRLPDNVIEAPVGKHSAKPPIVRVMIEKLYPEAKRLELFCRDPRDGWAVWGNEV